MLIVTDSNRTEPLTQGTILEQRINVV